MAMPPTDANTTNKQNKTPKPLVQNLNCNLNSITMVDKIKKELGVETGAEKSDECVKVAIRCRPLSTKETEAGHVQVVKINPKMGEIYVSRADGNDAK